VPTVPPLPREGRQAFRTRQRVPPWPSVRTWRGVVPARPVAPDRDTERSPLGACRCVAPCGRRYRGASPRRTVVSSALVVYDVRAGPRVPGAPGSPSNQVPACRSREPGRACRTTPTGLDPRPVVRRAGWCPAMPQRPTVRSVPGSPVPPCGAPRARHVCAVHERTRSRTHPLPERTCRSGYDAQLNGPSRSLIDVWGDYFRSSYSPAPRQVSRGVADAGDTGATTGAILDMSSPMRVQGRY
jgi:hypothetical protein